MARVTKAQRCNTGTKRERLYQKTIRKRYNNNAKPAKKKAKKKFSSG